MKNEKQKFRSRVQLTLVVLTVLIVIMGFVAVSDVVAQQADTGGTASVQQISPEKAEISKYGLIAAAIAFGFGAIGAGMAIAHVGAAAMGAIGEKPEIASQALIFIALAEGLVVFGFIAALMILGKF